MTTKDDLVTQIDELGKAVRRRDLPADKIEEVSATVSGLQEVVEDVKPRRRSLLDFKGLGKDYWRSINVEEYLRKERESWD